MSKSVKILNLVVEIVYIICVTLAAMHFNRIGLLWWYVLVLFLRAYRGH
jgi:hypothetical protein